ncbi:universal stress protein [Mycolicibacterium palauense]|uniref:universal stress protein n=1 Tax=Mycolicibacterium palauense TaxID=2034511 RepID=UPI000BFF0EBD
MPNTAGILVGVDGSEYSDAALRWAVREAAMRHEALTVMSVAERADPHSYDTGTIQELRREQHAEGDRILAAAQRIVDETLGDRTLRQVQMEFLFAHPLSTLIDASKDVRMVVVGCRGMGALDRLTLGSVSSGLVRHAHSPVAVIHREHAEPAAHAPVLLGVDGTTASELATAIAFDEASHRHAPLVAMHAWADALSVAGHFNFAADESKGGEVLSERLAGWQEKYPDVSVTPTLVRQDPGPWLVNHSDDAQLVVVGSHGRGGFAGMLLGSVSATVVHAAEVPVIVARTS